MFVVFCYWLDWNSLQWDSWFVETDENIGVQEIPMLLILDTLIYIQGVWFYLKPEAVH